MSAWRQTTLAHFAQCLRSGLLSMRHPVSSAAARRGTAFHEFAERATRSMIEAGETAMPGEVGKELLAAVLSEPGFHVPPEEMDGLRAMVWNWCEHSPPLGNVALVEAPMRMEVAGREVTGRLDRVDVEDARLVVRDYKTGWAVPPVEEFERSFQPLFYACLLVYGETEWGEALGAGVEEVVTENIYPRLVGEDGRLVTRTAAHSRERLDDQLAYLEALVRRVEAAQAADEFEPTPGSWCEWCAAPAACPIAPVANPQAPTEDDPETLGAWLLVADRTVRDARKALRAHVKASEAPVRVGDMEWSFRKEERTTTDRDGLALGWEQAVYAGEQAGFDPSAYMRTSTSTRFAARKR